MIWEACAILQNSSPKEPLSFVVCLPLAVAATVAVAPKPNQRLRLLCVPRREPGNENNENIIGRAAQLQTEFLIVFKRLLQL
jgi:hypothetical protein